MKDVVLHQITPDCVILAYHGQGTPDAEGAPHRSSIASTYVKRNGRWQLALTAHQPWKPEDKTAGPEAADVAVSPSSATGS
jgi:hypothetical protein